MTAGSTGGMKEEKKQKQRRRRGRARQQRAAIICPNKKEMESVHHAGEEIQTLCLPDCDWFYVKTLTGKTITLTGFTGTNTVMEVKEQLAEKEGAPIEKQRLICAGKELADSSTLTDCRVGWEGTVHLITK